MAEGSGRKEMGEDKEIYTPFGGSGESISRVGRYEDENKRKLKGKTLSRNWGCWPTAQGG